MAQTPAQLENLKKCIPFTSETGSAAGKIGGPRAAAARKRNKSMAALAQKLTEASVTSTAIKKELKELGIEDADMTNTARIVAGVFREATIGNIGAVEKIEAWQERANVDSGLDADGNRRQFFIPAKSIARSFVDLNREIGNSGEEVIEGGRGSTKSSYISLKIIELMRNNPELNCCCIRKVAATLRDSVYTQIQWAISELGLDAEYKATVSPMQIRDIQTGQTIYFRGLDDPKKIKSIKPKTGYLGILWIEEADQLNGPEELRNVRQSILRGGDGLTFLSYNPPKSRMSWVNRYTLAPAAYTHVHHSDYRDVPASWLGTAFLEEAEHLKQTDPDAYEHEYLGKAIGDGANVFDKIEIRTITDEEIAACDHIYQGNDWGYSPDPLAFVRLNYDHHREEILFIDEIVRLKTQNSEAAEEIKKRGYTDADIICDSAERKSTADYRSCGLPAFNAVKGPDSVRYGLKWLAGRKLIIDPARTPNVYREFVGYEHERDKDGNILSGYPDKDNHTIDAVRYALERVWSKYYSRA